MLTTSKQTKLQENLKQYSKRYLNGKITELDESGTRLMINSFLTDVLGYAPIEEIKTEYMIKGTYADYVIQLAGKRHFLVEVKALSIALTEGHLRQAINYGANEGIEWALLTNGRSFDLYKILFNKPIESCKVFSFDFSDPSQVKKGIDLLQYLHRDSLNNKGLDFLWNKCSALEPANIAGLLYTPNVLNYVRKALKERFKHKFSEDDVRFAINRVVSEPLALEKIKHVKIKKEKPKVKVVADLASSVEVAEGITDAIHEQLPISQN